MTYSEKKPPFGTSNQALKSLRNFIGPLFRIIWVDGKNPIEMPTPPMALRVAVAGHLQIGTPASLQFALSAILTGIREYAFRINGQYSETATIRDIAFEPKPPELRILCQLAQGVDQMAAETGLELGYALHAVLPGTKAEVEADILHHRETNSNELRNPDPLQKYHELLAKAIRVLELDRPIRTDSSELLDESYAQASSIILDHSDIVLVVVHERGTDHSGGTKWVEQRAEDLNLPVIRIPMEQPSLAALNWTNDGRRESRSLFNAMSEGVNPAIFEPALSGVLLHQTSKSPYRLGWFENRMIKQLDPGRNFRFWDERWTLPGVGSSLAEHSLGTAMSQIDNDLRSAKVWADHRASAMANIVRGSFIFCSLLGMLAVCGAIIGMLVPALGKSGKVVELACLIIILCFIHRSVKWNWRVQWLSLRQLERSIEQAAWLLTIGRIPSFVIPAHANQFQGDEHSSWANWYLRSILRASSFPNAQLDSDYIKTVLVLVSQNLIRNQIDYFESEAAVYHKTDETLERWIKRCIVLAFLVTFLYLVSSYVETWVFHLNITRLHEMIEWIAVRSPHLPMKVATVVGTLMPAIAAGLAAVRSHGEYAQIAARYQGTSRSLKSLENQIDRRMPDGRKTQTVQPLRSAEVAELLAAATASLFQEVISWQSILRTKEIEPV